MSAFSNRHLSFLHLSGILSRQSSAAGSHPQIGLDHLPGSPLHAISARLPAFLLQAFSPFLMNHLPIIIHRFATHRRPISLLQYALTREDIALIPVIFSSFLLPGHSVHHLIRKGGFSIAPQVLWVFSPQLFIAKALFSILQETSVLLFLYAIGSLQVISFIIPLFHCRMQSFQPQLKLWLSSFGAQLRQIMTTFFLKGPFYFLHFGISPHFSKNLQQWYSLSISGHQL